MSTFVRESELSPRILFFLLSFSCSRNKNHRSPLIKNTDNSVAHRSAKCLPTQSRKLSFLAAWCLVIAQIQLSWSSGGSSLPPPRQQHATEPRKSSQAPTHSPDSLCRSTSFSAPHRARVFYRWPMASQQRVVGCVDEAVVSDVRPDASLIGAFHLQQTNKHSIERLMVRMRVSPPNSGEFCSARMIDASSSCFFSWLWRGGKETSRVGFQQSHVGARILRFFLVFV